MLDSELGYWNNQPSWFVIGVFHGHVVCIVLGGISSCGYLLASVSFLHTSKTNLKWYYRRLILCVWGGASQSDIFSLACLCKIISCIFGLNYLEALILAFWSLYRLQVYSIFTVYRFSQWLFAGSWYSTTCRCFCEYIIQHDHYNVILMNTCYNPR